MQKLNSFQSGYIEAALWSSTDETDEQGGEPLDRNYTLEDIAPEALAKMLADCDAFEAQNEDLLALAGTREQNGHDFWLNRNGHGVGFWDRGYLIVGEKLSDACKAFGEASLYVGDDNLIYNFDG